MEPDFVVYGNPRVIGCEHIESPSFGMRSPYGGGGFHADVHALEFQPNVANPKLFCGNIGGVSVKTLPDKSIKDWEYMNEGLEVVPIWSFDDSEFTEGQAIIGLQDNGTLVYVDTMENKWQFIKGGDCYSKRINDATPDEANLSGDYRSPAFFNFKTL